MTGHDALIERIRTARFTVSRAAGNYEMERVDDFLGGLIVTLEQGRSIEALVDLVRFSTVRLRAGYDTFEVDQFLDEVVAESSGAGAPRAVEQPDEPSPAGPETQVEPDVEAPRLVTEQRGLFTRLFGR